MPASLAEVRILVNFPAAMRAARGSENRDLDKEAVGIVVMPLTDKGAPEQIMDIVAGRLGTMLTERQGEVTVSQEGERKYAWAEYAGISPADGTPLQYFLSVIATPQRSAFVFSSTAPDQRESPRPKFQAIVYGVTLHSAEK